MIRWSILILLLVAISLPGQNELVYRKLSTENGLKSNTIYSLLQSKSGRIFIGHEKGISTYNGIQLEHLNPSKVQMSISNLIEKEPNDILCRDFHGGAYFADKDSAYIINKNNKLPWGFLAYAQDQGKTYAYQNNFLFQVNNNNIFVPITLLGAPEYERIWSLEILKDTLYAMITSKGNTTLLVYDLIAKKTINTETEKGIKEKLLVPLNGSIYLYNRENLTISLIKNGRIEAQKSFEGLKQSTKITFIKSLKNKTILVGTFDGLYVYDEFLTQINYFLQGVQPSACIVDKEENIWIGTLQDGILIIPSLQITNFKLEDALGKNTKISRSEKIDEDNFIIGTYDGKLAWIDKNSGIKKIIQLPKKGEVQAIKYISKTNSLIVFCDFLYEIDNKSGKIITSKKVQATKAIAYRNSTILCGSSKGVFFGNASEFQVYHNSYWIKNLCFTNDNYCLLETDKGLKLFNLKTKSLSPLPDSAAIEAVDLVSDDSLIYFRNGNIIYSYINQIVSKYYSCDVGIEKLFYSNGKLFILTVTKELKEISSNKSITINRYNGLQQKELINVYNNKGELTLIGLNGIQYFKKIKNKNTIPPTVEINSIQGTFYSNNNLLTSEYNENKLELQLEVLPNITSEGNDMVYYRIPEIDSTWENTLPNNGYLLKLERLPFGELTLQYYAINEAGLPSEINDLKIKIEKPFYLTYWFIILCLIILCTLTYLFIRARISILNKKNKEILEKEKLKLKALNAELTAIRSQMNPHFIFNSLSSIQTQILNEEHLNAYQNLSTFSRLLRQALQFSSQEFISLKNELAFLENYIELEQMRSNNTITFMKNIHPLIDLDSEKFPSLLLQPYVENAIKHGLHHIEGEKILKLNLTKQVNGYQINIEDNGIGRKKSEALNKISRKDHQSFATNAMQERIEMINSTSTIKISIQIEDLNEGTRVNIIVENTN